MTAPATLTALPVRTLDELFDRQADAALAIGGAGRSCWNGRIEWLPRPGSDEPPGVVGIADWDGTISIYRTILRACIGRGPNSFRSFRRPATRSRPLFLSMTTHSIFRRMVAAELADMIFLSPIE